MKNILIMIAIMAGGSVVAQNGIESVLTEVVQNNTALKALKDDIEAQKLDNKTGIYLSNPEVEFNYLWGAPNNIGNRNDINVSQTFDFPTITGMKRRIADKRNGLLELQYKSERLNVMLMTRQLCMDLIYYNALKNELDLRLQHAEILAEGYKNRLDNGDANILEYNKAQLNLATVKGEISNLETERGAVFAELKRLNGGVAVQMDDAEYENVILPDDFDEWFAVAEQSNPVLEYVRQEVEIAKSQVSLNKARSLPEISAGFMREKVVGEAYQGVSIGVSIPLWANKNKVRQAKAAVKAGEAKQIDSRLQFYEYLQALYEKAKGLKATADNYSQSLESLNSVELLKKALNEGEISLLDYIMEIGLYYNTVNSKLETEREFHKTLMKLITNN
jgi:outer membrane protein TolC